MDLQTQIRNNSLKVYLYMSILTAIVGLLGYLVSIRFNWGLTGTGIFLIVAGLINFLAYFFSHKLIIFSSGAKPISKEQAPEYDALVERLTKKAQLPMPKLYLINERAMNAFATGRNYNNAVVAVTRGLLEKLTSVEIEAVVAHELAHIKFYDMRLMAVISILAGFISICADIFWRSSMMQQVSSKDRSGSLQIIGLLLALFAPITAFLVQLAISRRREFVADAYTVELLGSGIPLASALGKISRDQMPLPNVSMATAHLYISSTNKSNWVEKIMSTHPPIQERIQKLKEMTGDLN
jgi:heat shock protein HtpX